jgi:hypothetical protein
MGLKYNIHKKFLNEAYPDKLIDKLIIKFTSEASDLNIDLKDQDLRKIIKIFDKIKNKFPAEQRDIEQIPLARLIRLVTASDLYKKDENEEQDDIPDVVYNQNGIIVYSGHKENNCLIYGKGEKWCITRGSWPNYRYGGKKSTFYLIKNENLGETDPLSFIAVQAIGEGNNRGQYIYTNRNNSPHESQTMDWDELIKEIPFLEPLRNVLKIVPISKSEQKVNKYRDTSFSYQEWEIQLDNNEKKMFLISKRGKSLFEDIDNLTFFRDKLKQFPKIEEWISQHPSAFESKELVRYLPFFSEKNQLSLIRNIFTADSSLDIKSLKNNNISFEIKKNLLLLDRFSYSNNEVASYSDKYNAIIYYDSVNNSLGLITQDGIFDNIKKTPKTLDITLSLPENEMTKWKNYILQNATESNQIKKFLTQTKNNDLINIDGSYFIFNPTNFEIIELNKEIPTKISIPDNDMLSEYFKNNINKYKEDLLNVLNNTQSKSKSILNILYIASLFEQEYILYPEQNQAIITSPDAVILTAYPYNGINQLIFKQESIAGNISLLINPIKSFLRNPNNKFSENGLRDFGLSNYNSRGLITSLWDGIVMEDNSVVFPAKVGDYLLMVNKVNPSNSSKLSNAKRKYLAKNISQRDANVLYNNYLRGIGTPPSEVEVEVPVPRRGRPAGVPNAPRPIPAANEPAGTIDLRTIFDDRGLTYITSPALSRLLRTGATQMSIVNDRGVTRRNNQLIGVGRVAEVYGINSNRIYIIRLNNGNIFAQISIQPGARFFISTTTQAIEIDSPNQLLTTIRDRLLAENIMPFTISEFKHNYNKTNMEQNKLSKMIRETIKANQPEKSPNNPSREIETIPRTKPPSTTPTRRRGIEPMPGVKEVPKFEEGMENNINKVLSKIIQRYKKEKK